ncbi:MAG TPA: ABC transporter permease, partial [Pyrinomonadaceae bacterium]|nr:ABC transporter permease [Pyrinomonadaceae bacterium]
AIFSVVNSVLLRPLPFRNSDRLMTVWENNLKKGQDHEIVGSANFTDWKNQNQSFESLAAYLNWNYNLTGGDDPQRLNALVVSAGFFQTLGAEAELGRVLTAEDDQEGRDDVVVLSHALWQRQFGASRQIIGQTVMLNGKSHTVVGVMPSDFNFLDDQVEIWRPMAMSAQQAQSREGKYLKVIGRLKPGVTIEQAKAEIGTIAQRLEQQYPDTNAGWGVNIVPLREEIVGNVRPVLIILLGAVGFVLLIACTNIANLLLARASSRQKEIAVRAALGASRWRLIGQFLSESFLLAFAGGALGLLLALWGSDALIALSPDNIPRIKEAAIDGHVLAFTLLLTLLTTLIFGLAPAWQASKLDLNEALKDEGRSAAGSSGRRLRNLLVVAEVAIGVVLLVGAGLMINSFIKLQRVNAGFDTHNLLTMQITLPPARYGQNEQQIAFFQQAIEKIKTLPGVKSVGAIQDLPLRLNNMSFPVTLEGRTESQSAQSTKAGYRAVTDEYFRTLGIPLLEGRLFTAHDDQNSTPVLVINQTMARSFWPGEDPVGKRIHFGEPNDPLYSIVGVVGDIKHMGLDADEGAVMYQPHAQKRFSWLRWMTIVVRTENDPLSLAPAVRSRILEVDKNQPVYNIATMEQLLTKSTAQPRFSTLLLGIFALLALCLAAIGIYGVMSYNVTQRTHEIGVRMALGAQMRDVMKLIIRQGMKMVLVGVALGLLGAIAITRVMKSLLFGVTATDPLTFAVVAVLLTMVALLACYLPARRAAKVDPLVALRYE